MDFTSRKPAQCRECPYFENDYIPPRLDDESLQANMVLIGEAPGREERERGEYFVCDAG
jgi:uracil-DNA glycosylase